MDNSEWKNMAKAELQALLKNQKVKVVDLVDRLNQLGIKETKRSAYNKLSRGTFSFAWFLQVLKALELEIQYRPSKKQ